MRGSACLPLSVQAPPVQLSHLILSDSCKTAEASFKHRLCSVLKFQPASNYEFHSMYHSLQRDCGCFYNDQFGYQGKLLAVFVLSHWLATQQALNPDGKGVIWRWNESFHCLITHTFQKKKAQVFASQWHWFSMQFQTFFIPEHNLHNILYVYIHTHTCACAYAQQKYMHKQIYNYRLMCMQTYH